MAERMAEFWRDDAMVYSEDSSLILFVNRGRYKTTDSLMTFRFPCGSPQLERILTEVQGLLMADCGLLLCRLRGGPRVRAAVRT